MVNGFPFLAAGATGSNSGASSNVNSSGAALIQLGLIVLIIVAFYFIAIRPQKKREKKMNEMRNNLQVGDQITTTGGIVGRVVNIKDQTVTLETGADRVKIRIMRWAIATNDTVHDE